ncbi:MAG TPA: TIM barrel protein [Herpetosiphonaceae bacterium]|nr:TIM barrel protein [Herpetosiphonaceae bacterium]
MRLAFSKPTSTADEQQLLFSNFRPVGYDGLQLKLGQYRDYIDQPQRFVEEWGHIPGIASALIFGAGLDQGGIASLRKLFAFAGAVGTDLIVFCHALSRQGLSHDDIRGFARTLSELGKEAQQHGTKLSLHHHYDQPVMHRPDFDVFFDAVDDQSVGLTVDTAHLVKSGITDVAGVIRDFGHVIDNFHLKDFADGDWRVLGQGDIDFGPIFAAIRDINYDGWLSADEESGSELLDAMHACHRYITSALSLQTS